MSKELQLVVDAQVKLIIEEEKKIKAQAEENRINELKKVKEKLGLTVEQALEIWEIPMEKREIFASRWS